MRTYLELDPAKVKEFQKGFSKRDSDDFVYAGLFIILSQSYVV